MANPAQTSSINIGLPSLPETTDPRLFSELIRVYNAINILAQSVDSYTADGTVVGSLASKANDAEVVHITGLTITEGSNKKQGIGILVAGTLTVANTSVTANSRIFLTGQLDGGTVGFLRVSSRIVGTSFTVKSSSNLDTSTFAYIISEPLP